MVSLCLLIRLIDVCADRDQPEFLCSCSDSRCLKVHVATAGGWLTCYRPREVRNSIYRYRKIHIDYRSKFLYRFISSISIIYGNTTIIISPVSEGYGFTSKPPAARNGVNAITQKPQDGLFSNLVYTLVVIVS